MEQKKSFLKLNVSDRELLLNLETVALFELCKSEDTNIKPWLEVRTVSGGHFHFYDEHSEEIFQNLNQIIEIWEYR